MKPNVGMVYPVYAPISAYTPGTGVTYGTGAVVSEARGATLNWDRSDGEFYGDDTLLDSDNGITGYTLDFEPAGLSDAIRAGLLGEVAASSEYSITNAAAPDVGFGYIRVMREENSSGLVVTTYEAWWFYKLKFGVSSEETRTKERSVEWRVPTLQGVGAGISLDATGELSFCQHKSFNDLASAKSYLNGKAGIT